MEPRPGRGALLGRVVRVDQRLHPVMGEQRGGHLAAYDIDGLARGPLDPGNALRHRRRLWLAHGANPSVTS
ncbi:hypothetical protein GCM10007979_13280 [Nocardioides albus]|nr:hypothetical protein GCM10007979_13280 [Nocardioides albus]